MAALTLTAVCAAVHADRVELAWQKLPGDYAWLGGAGSNTERGIAYNPVTKHVLVVHRNTADAPQGIYIVDAETGDQIMTADDPPVPKTLDLTDISGGTFALNMIDVGDDGAIYACNLTTSTTAPFFKVYRWEDEDSIPTLAYAGDPSEGVAGATRYGDNFAVRGAGNDTQLMAGARNTSHVAIFTTENGIDFVSTLVEGAGATTGSIGVAFGSGNTGWSKLNGSNPLRHFSFDLTTKVATLIEGITISPTSVAPIGADPTGKLLAALDTPNSTTTAGGGRVYDISAGGAVLVGEVKYQSVNANGNGVGGADIGDNMAFFISPNNGILALRIISEVTPVSISTQPAAAVTVIEGGRVTLTVTAAGTPPLTYQWTHEGTNLPGATSQSLTLTNFSADDAGSYQVIVDNAGDPVTSDASILTMQPIVRGNSLTLKWRKNTFDLPFLSDDGTARGIAYNPATDHVLVISRSPAIAINVLDAKTGNPVMNGETPLTLNLDPSIVTGASPAEFRVNMIGVAEDGAIYAANLTTGSAASPFKIYRWDNESPDTLPYPVYLGDPSGGLTDPAPDKRFGDTFDVRGSGDNTEILVGSRNGNVAVLIKPNPDPFLAAATVIYVPDAPAGAFGLSVAFGSGNSFYGTSFSQPVRLITYDLPNDGSPVVNGIIARSYDATEIPTAVGHVVYDPTNKFLAGNAFEVPDNVQLYRVADDGAATLIDQELYELDASNANGTGSLDFGGGMLFAIDTNNGILAFDVSNVTEVGQPTLSALSRAANGSVTLTIAGDAGATYTVESANSLSSPIQWSTVQQITIPAGGSSVITDAAATGQDQRYYRAIAAPTP